MAEAASSPVLQAQSPAEPAPAADRGGAQGWTLVLVSLGIVIIAWCILIPQADENRKLAYEVAKLRQDLDHVTRQVQSNDEFIRRVGHDPGLAERLAQRQMRLIRKGSDVLKLDENDDEIRSAFLLAAVPPPVPLPPLELKGGRLANLCRDGRTRLYLIGAGLMLLATGLVLGHGDGGKSAV